MAGEWPRFKLGDLCGLITDGKHGDCEDHADSGFYFLSVKDVVGNRLVYENARQITERDFAETHRRTNLEPGDVLFTNTGTIGRMALAQEDPRTYRTTFQKSVAILKPKRNLITPRFLYYLLHFDNAKLSDFAAGTTQKNLLLKDLRSFTVRVPSLPEQHAIAHIFGTLDDKIDLNRRMNETLEAMARALFKSWFVDFDPVRAKHALSKVEGAEGRPSASSGQAFPGLPQALADLFPDSFEDSELGEIPKGWEVGTLAEFASINPESWSKETRPDIINYLDLSNTKWGSIEAVTIYKPRDAPSRAQRVLRPGDTIVGTVRPGNGSYALISADGLTGSTGFAVLRPRRPEYAQFVYLVATAAESIEAFSHLADGGAYPAVRPEVVIATQAIRPGDKVLAQFSMLSDPLLAKMAHNQRESHTLTALRDTLLPKLLSGEITTSKAET